MPVKNEYKHVSVSNIKKKIITISQFNGVDFTSPKFNVSNSRAINLQNFLFKNEHVQKRSGYEDIFKVNQVEYFDRFTGFYYKNGVNFNGMWKFKAEDGEWHIVAHIGNLLFEIRNIDSKEDKISIIPINDGNQSHSGTNSSDQTVSLPYLYRFEDYKSFAFVGANRLWFLGGNKYMCLRFRPNNTVYLYPVENCEEAFIPTTSIGITYEGAITGGRTTLDFPNKLNYFRKNKLLSGVGRDEESKTKTKYFEYTLDAPLIINKDQTILNHTCNDIEKISVVIRTRRKEEE